VFYGQSRDPLRIVTTAKTGAHAAGWCLITAILVCIGCNDGGHWFTGQGITVKGRIGVDDGKAGVPCTLGIGYVGADPYVTVKASSGQLFREPITVAVSLNREPEELAEQEVVVQCEGYVEERPRRFRPRFAWFRRTSLDVGDVMVEREAVEQPDAADEVGAPSHQ
jgi:hypothetical protein